MKKLLFVMLCGLIAASALVSAQNTRDGDENPFGADPFGGVSNPFGGVSNPFGGDDSDPFGGDDSDPFGGDDSDPFGGDDSDPFGGDDSDPFGGDDSDPFGGDDSDPFGGDDANSGDDSNPFGGDDSEASDANPFADSSKASDPFAKPAVAAPDEPAGRDPFGPGANSPPRPAKGTAPGTKNYFIVPLHEPTDARRRIEAILGQPAKFEYLDVPLNQVLDDLRFSHELPLVLDGKSLEDFGVDTATPIVCNLSGISVRSALRLMLRELELTYVIRDEVLMITTPEEAKMQPLVALYPLSDELAGKQDDAWLVELVTGVIAPDTWTTGGGTGTVVYVPHLRMLAVRHNDEVLAEVGKLLKSLEEVAKARHATLP